MAQPGYEQPQAGDKTKNISVQRARQGQNVKGMIWVLVVSIGLIVAAYAIMLSLQAEPVTPGNRAVEDVAPAANATGAPPTAPETPQSPP